jgi:hypothetical protein
MPAELPFEVEWKEDVAGVTFIGYADKNWPPRRYMTISFSDDTYKVDSYNSLRIAFEKIAQQCEYSSLPNAVEKLCRVRFVQLFTVDAPNAVKVMLGDKFQAPFIGKDQSEFTINNCEDAMIYRWTFFRDGTCTERLIGIGYANSVDIVEDYYRTKKQENERNAPKN